MPLSAETVFFMFCFFVLWMYLFLPVQLCLVAEKV